MREFYALAIKPQTDIEKQELKYFNKKNKYLCLSIDPNQSTGEFVDDSDFIRSLPLHYFKFIDFADAKSFSNDTNEILQEQTDNLLDENNKLKSKIKEQNGKIGSLTRKLNTYEKNNQKSNSTT